VIAGILAVEDISLKEVNGFFFDVISDSYQTG
jgi:hypothetical protein